MIVFGEGRKILWPAAFSEKSLAEIFLAKNKSSRKNSERSVLPKNTLVDYIFATFKIISLL